MDDVIEKELNYKCFPERLNDQLKIIYKNMNEIDNPVLINAILKKKL
jgi:hypothetical protein